MSEHLTAKTMSTAELPPTVIVFVFLGEGEKKRESPRSNGYGTESREKTSVARTTGFLARDDAEDRGAEDQGDNKDEDTKIHQTVKCSLTSNIIGKRTIS